MRTNYKNIALLSSLMLFPLKSENVAKECTRIISNVNQTTIKTNSFTENIWNNTQKMPGFLEESMLALKELEAKGKIKLTKVPKPSKSMNVAKTRYEGSPEYLNTFLDGVLKGKGKNFIDAQNKYGINATFLIGIANHESARGTSDFARNKNNIAGMRGKKGYMDFASIDECIDRMAANLKKRYIDDGLTTIEQINKRYAESEVWGECVVNHMNPIYSNSKCMIFNF